MLVRDIDRERTNYATQEAVVSYLQEGGLSPRALDAYAAKARLTGMTPGETRGRAAEDLLWVMRQVADSTASADLAALTLRSFLGYVLADPSDMPLVVRLERILEQWGQRPIGWLALAAGLTPREYDKRTPDVATLLTLAALRHPAAALADLAEDLA
jgi:hypothetical protein